MKRQIMAALALALALLGVAVIVAPSVAQADFSSCPSGRLCVYNGTNGGGVPDLYSATSLADCENMHAGTDNSASSVYNRLTVSVTLKKGAGCSGASSLTVGAGVAISNLATPCCAWDNSVSSARL